MLDYASLKALHVGCVVASATLFFSRGVLMLAAPAALQGRWARIAPHIVDTLLLAAAVGMLVVLFFIVSVALTKRPWPISL